MGIPYFAFVLLAWLAASIAFLIVVFVSSAKRSSKAGVTLFGAALLFLTFTVGAHFGRQSYYKSLRSELSPFLRLLGSVSAEKKNEALKDFFLGADEIKTTPEEYLASLKHAHGLLKKKPNQSPEPTAMSVTPPAAQESRQP